MNTTIQLDATGESQVFAAARPVRNSDHANGTIAEGRAVLFRGDRDGGIVMVDAETGEPTNGNQYATFATLADAEAFAARAGFVARA